MAGQVAVIGTDHIRRVSLVPADPPAPGGGRRGPRARPTRSSSDPGSLFTSVLAAVAVPEIREAVNRVAGPAGSTSATCAPRSPRRAGFDVAMHVEALVGHGVTVDLVVCDTAGIALGEPAVPVVDVPPGPGQRPGPRSRQTGVDPGRSARMMP